MTEEKTVRPNIRRVMPTIIAGEIRGVAPMCAPSPEFVAKWRGPAVIAGEEIIVSGECTDVAEPSAVRRFEK